MSYSFEQLLSAISAPGVNFSETEPFFCNICGGPATSRGLLKHSTFPEIDEQDEDDDFDEERDLFMDYCNCGAQGHPVSITCNVYGTPF